MCSSAIAVNSKAGSTGLSHMHHWPVLLTMLPVHFLGFAHIEDRHSSATKFNRGIWYVLMYGNGCSPTTKAMSSMLACFHPNLQQCYHYT